MSPRAMRSHGRHEESKILRPAHRTAHGSSIRTRSCRALRLPQMGALIARNARIENMMVGALDHMDGVDLDIAEMGDRGRDRRRAVAERRRVSSRCARSQIRRASIGLRETGLVARGIGHNVAGFAYVWSGLAVYRYDRDTSSDERWPAGRRSSVSAGTDRPSCRRISRRGRPAPAALIVTTTATAAAARGKRGLIVAIFAGRHRTAAREDLRLQRLVLQRVEVAAVWIAARSLPACDHRAGRFVELAGRLDVEAEPGEAALDVAALAAIETELILGDLARLPR